MAKSYILAGTLQIRMLDPSTGNLILSSSSLQDNTFSVGVTAEDIRGGLTNKLWGRYFHDSTMSATITDALFSLEHLASQVGGNIVNGGEVIENEAITITVADTITVSKTPISWFNVGTIGWYTIAGEDNWQTFTFTGNTATVAGLPVGTNICVQYMVDDSAARYFEVSAAIIPSIVTLEVTGALFQTGIGDNFQQSARAGTLLIQIPRFSLDGSLDISMNASGASTTNISGSALAYADTLNCNDEQIYGKITEIIFGRSWYEDLVSMAVSNADIELAAGQDTLLDVVGIFNNSTSRIANSNLTFTATDTAVATVDATGKVTAVAAGTTTIEIVVTDKPTVVAYANVTVN